MRLALLLALLLVLLSTSALARRDFPSDDRTHDWRMQPVPRYWKGQWYQPGQGPCWNWFPQYGGWRWVCK